MNFFSMMLFRELFSIHNECSKNHSKDSDEYKKCKELKQFNTELLQKFLDKNKELLKQYVTMLEDFQNQQSLLQMYSIQQKIDQEIYQYISQEEQNEFIIEYFNLKDLLKEYEFGR